MIEYLLIPQGQDFLACNQRKKRIIDTAAKQLYVGEL